MGKKKKRLVTLLLSLLMIISSLPTTELTVEAAANPKLAKKSASIIIGGTSKIKVKNAPKGSKITYKSAKKSIATVTKQGNVKGIKNGTTNITVSVNKNSKTTKLTYKVTVKKPILSKSKLSLKSGSTAKLSIKNKPKKAKYIWSSNNSRVAAVNKNGKVTAKTKGTAIIKAKVKITKKTYNLSCKITVKSESDNQNDVKQTYTVTFDSNGGSSVPSQTVEKNAKATPPTDPTRNGYTFDGWYTTASGGQKFDFNTTITGNITLYAHWRNRDDKQDAKEYYETYSDLIDIIAVEESKNVLTEAQVKSVLEERGFVNYSITYDYSINGDYTGETAIWDDSTDKHPIYQTFYLSENGEGWTVYLINGEVFANPVSFNLESDLGAQLLVSESETLTSYDDKSNKFYSTIPYASEAIMETVDRIDTETLDRLTIEEICRLSGATIPATTNEKIYSDKSAVAFSLDNLNAADPVSTIAKYSTDDPLIVVSLGDSYSSGEGIEEFYGQNKSLSEKVKDYNWLAHRSKKSWPSLLKIPGVEGTMSDYIEFGDTSTADVQWYFGAVSGAETKHIKNEEFKKSYIKRFNDGISINPLLMGSENLPKQLDIFDNIKGKVDYVTLTIGGNDVNFAGVITKCVTESSYLKFGKTTGLEKMLNKLWDNIGTTMAKIKQVYKDIEDAAGSQASIIVAGYPELLDKNGKGFAISRQEATQINEKVRDFNGEIKKVVTECYKSKMKIFFVDVEEEFNKDGGHQAYSQNAWINPVWIGAKSQDINDLSISSSYSVHPNEQGAQAYARCVNAKIEELERGGYVLESGTCEESLSWKFTVNGRLTVSGNGLMTHFYNDGMRPWTKYMQRITQVVIEDGVENIGLGAFYKCSNLVSVIIPESVTIITGEAFEYCTSLENIVIPNGVTDIGAWAFADCSNLKSVTLPESVSFMGSYVFDGCSSELVLNVVSGSYAEAYAKKNGIQYQSTISSGN